MPTHQQLEGLYRICYYLTYRALQAIHLICTDERTDNLMSEINYDKMSDQELRQYFLEHKNEQSALQAYLQRRNQQPRQVITKVGDPDFDLNIEQAIKSKLDQRTNKN